MRHRKSGRKLNMDGSQRKAMFRNMVTSLMLHGQIRTTEARAKELRRFADRVITMGKNAPSRGSLEGLSGTDLQAAKAARVTAIRRVRLWVNNDTALKSVVGDYADRFRTRPGGYTRVIKAGRRPGDNAAMAIVQLVGEYNPSEAPVAAPDVSADFDDEATVVMANPTEEAGEAEIVEE